MSVELLHNGKRKTRKPHQCFHCYQMIPKGASVQYSTCKFEDRVYTLYFHPGCADCWDRYSKDAGLSPYDFIDGGYPPLQDEWGDSGEMEMLCNEYRGIYPHVIARLELIEQKAALRLGEEVYG